MGSQHSKVKAPPPPTSTPKQSTPSLQSTPSRPRIVPCSPSSQSGNDSSSSTFRARSIHQSRRRRHSASGGLETAAFQVQAASAQRRKSSLVSYGRVGHPQRVNDTILDLKSLFVDRALLDGRPFGGRWETRVEHEGMDDILTTNATSDHEQRRALAEFTAIVPNLFEGKLTVQLRADPMNDEESDHEAEANDMAHKTKEEMEHEKALAEARKGKAVDRSGDRTCLNDSGYGSSRKPYQASFQDEAEKVESHSPDTNSPTPGSRKSQTGEGTAEFRPADPHSNIPLLVPATPTGPPQPTTGPGPAPAVISKDRSTPVPNTQLEGQSILAVVALPERDTTQKRKQPDDSKFGMPVSQPIRGLLPHAIRRPPVPGPSASDLADRKRRSAEPEPTVPPTALQPRTSSVAENEVAVDDITFNSSAITTGRKRRRPERESTNALPEPQPQTAVGGDVPRLNDRLAVELLSDSQKRKYTSNDPRDEPESGPRKRHQANFPSYPLDEFSNMRPELGQRSYCYVPRKFRQPYEGYGTNTFILPSEVPSRKQRILPSESDTEQPRHSIDAALTNEERRQVIRDSMADRTQRDKWVVEGVRPWDINRRMGELQRTRDAERRRGRIERNFESDTVDRPASGLPISVIPSATETNATPSQTSGRQTPSPAAQISNRLPLASEPGATLHNLGSPRHALPIVQPASSIAYESPGRPARRIFTSPLERIGARTQPDEPHAHNSATDKSDIQPPPEVRIPFSPVLEHNAHSPQ